MRFLTYFDKLNTTTLTVIVLLGLSLAVSSCQKEEYGALTESPLVIVNVKNQDTRAEASGTATRSIALEGDSGISMELREYVSENTLGLPGAETRGTVITTDGLNQTGQQFAIDGYLAAEITSMEDAEDGDKSDFHFIKARNVKRQSSDWTWTESAPQWRYKVASTFWSYYPISANGTRTITLPGNGSPTPQTSAQASISMDYTVATGDLTDDTSLQEDLLFAYNNYTCQDKESAPEVQIVFKHALAAVRFDVTDVHESIIVENIRMTGIYSSASCNISGTADRMFDWGTPDTPASFGQDVDETDFAISGSRSVQPFDGGKIFFMIPQELAADAKAEVRFKRLSDGRTFTHKASLAGVTWMDGNYYTYAIKCNGLFGFDLMDENNLSIVDTDGTQEADSHFGDAIVRFSGVKPTRATVTVSDPFGGAQFNPLTTYNTAADWLEFGVPAAKDAFADYPGASSTVNIRQLLAELGPDGTKAHFIAEDEDGDGVNDWYYTQVFINENYYGGSSPADFVNKPDRTCTISLGTDNVTPSSIVFGQKSIQSPYNLSTAGNPIGVEFIEESTAQAGTSSSDWCTLRNRVGSNVWRAPTLQEYWNIWYGTHSIDQAAWLGLSSSPVPAQYLSSDGFAYNGQKSASIASPSGYGTVRCVRDLGTGASGSAMSSVSVLDGDTDSGETTKIYVLSTSNVSSESLRSKITGRELSGTINPGSGLDSEDNKLYSAIQVGTKYLKWPVPNEYDVYPRYEYNLAVNKDRSQSINDFSVSCDPLKTVIEGSVKMINPDPRLVYSTSFTKLNGAVDPKPGTEWSYLDERGVLHFHVEYSGWSAQNSGSGWILKAAIKQPDGSVASIGGSNICTLYFAITKKNLSGAWGTAYSANPPQISGGIMIGDAPIVLGQESFRLVVVDGGPYSVQNVSMPKYSEKFEGSASDENMQYLDFACRNYYYEDTRFANGVERKSDLGQWRAPNQRELNMILEHSAELPVYRSMPTGNYITVGDHSTPEYIWSLDYNWASPLSGDGDRISSLGIRNSGNPYFNVDGLIDSDSNAPYRVRCVRDR